MPRERRINEPDADRAEGPREKIRDKPGSWPSFIKTPEETAKDSLIKMIESEGC